MLKPRELGRLARITRIFVKHDLDEFVTALHLFRPYRLILRLMPWRLMRGRPAPRGVRLREALEELGPVFVKFGQVLSTRPDLLPEDIAEELAKLQDQVPPFPGREAARIVEEALAAPITERFASFDSEPIASASVAQVHIARLGDGTEVAVKVLRPGIESVIERDVELLYVVARLAHRYLPDGPRLRPVEVVDQFRRTIRHELDLRREAANASQLRANFAGSDLLYVPKIYWDLTRRDVMVMERIHGIPISNVEALRQAGVDLRRLAHNGVEIFFTQAFRDGFFHADMHPGNIFVSTDGQYRAVDFGIMGSLGEEDKRYLAENFIAFFNRDYRAVAEAHLRAGWVPADTPVGEFEAAIRAVCEPIFARPLRDISFGRLLLQLFQTARQFNMEIQPQLVLLQKTLFNIEGLGRRLYPDLDLWVTAKPYLENWARDHLGPRALFRVLRQELPKWWEWLPRMPGLVHDTLARARDGELELEWKSAEIRQLRQQMRRSQQRMYWTVAGSGLLVSAAVIWTVGGYPLGDVTLGGLFGSALAATGVFFLWRGRPTTGA
ncbi:ubiquinone biosynthesis protein UbiB [Sulfurifustis variabilis]|uniref:Probable protein kinase UbiB n=1 Tax=Sulfurifustis variabilis TaxID=1675686 RepID=A0A1B4V3C7_9GAMM|nr:ubiquinone biosynthesis regulatory protein kinase UbiB [Sulfurifustis variabilis]BAU46992.1 ubiquinone biosynthesis protein UbiB [Sulfurifustis variabilis]